MAQQPEPSASYALGAQIGSDLKKNDIAINLDEYIQGMKDALKGQLAFSDAACEAAIRKFQDEYRQKMMAKQLQVAETNKTEGAAFLAANKTKTGVMTLPSGLQYKVLKEGTGSSPKSSDRVKVHYTGKLLDGTVFDSSVQRGQPATFGVTQVIKGWTEALLKMKPGSKWELYIPADLAYGANGAPGGKIGPNATLIFEVELLEIQ